MNEVWSFIVGLIAVVIPGFGQPAEPVYAGYVEADYVYAAPSAAGSVAAMAVAEGQWVEAGALLFRLSDSQQRAALRAAEARATAAEANWRNLVTGSRAEEIAVIRASLGKAQADLALAQANFERSQRLAANDLVPQAKLDQDRASATSAKAQVDQLQAQLEVAELPARNAQIVAAEATLDAARADVDKARADLDDRTVVAPVAGFVDAVYFAVGESLAAGVPGVSIRPTNGLIAKFFVPETVRATLIVGQTIAVDCDGCGDGIAAAISRVATQPQFTPPVIYSREERDRLVYEVEAIFTDGVSLMPGQPISAWVAP